MLHFVESPLVLFELPMTSELRYHLFPLSVDQKEILLAHFKESNNTAASGVALAIHQEIDDMLALRSQLVAGGDGALQALSLG
jgi:hypothetical protein